NKREGKNRVDVSLPLTYRRLPHNRAHRFGPVARSLTVHSPDTEKVPGARLQARKDGSPRKGRIETLLPHQFVSFLSFWRYLYFIAPDIPYPFKRDCYLPAQGTVFKFNLFGNSGYIYTYGLRDQLQACTEQF